MPERPKNNRKSRKRAAELERKKSRRTRKKFDGLYDALATGRQCREIQSMLEWFIAPISVLILILLIAWR